MIRILQLINWLIIIWVLNEGILLVASEGAGFRISAALLAGNCIWLLAPALTLLAIQPSAPEHVRYVGYLANVVTAAAILALFANLGSAGFELMALLLITPLGLNLWGIWKFSGAGPSKLELVEPSDGG